MAPTAFTEPDRSPDELQIRRSTETVGQSAASKSASIIPHGNPGLRLLTETWAPTIAGELARDEATTLIGPVTQV